MEASDDSEQLEYLIPAKVLTNRDPIILGKLSIREFLQWAVVFYLIYLVFNNLPFDFSYRFVTAGILAFSGALFIHSPINGLAGIEWFYIWLRYALEKKRHSTLPAIASEDSALHKPVFNVSLAIKPASRTRVSTLEVQRPPIEAREDPQAHIEAAPFETEMDD